ncbi:hypothetical protein J2754_001469 [Halarchaeum solikamskense]|uniref:hypothetical protein n=1 Tax=Halarchaeum nitratireducens TaxID=489913 RepID=UPI001B3B0EF5|nr:hypothetical protein [Halarchaeum solikamskense]MBP2251148.1 hypothetical protein [Halarchaeum solikamskense]
MTYLDFEDEQPDPDNPDDDGSTSWQRADPARALIERHSPTDYVVMLQDGAAPHAVAYGLERGARVGFCDCDGFHYSDESVPCAHLCVLRKSEFIGAESVDGQRIEAVDTAVLAEADHDPGLRADGGPRRAPSHDPDARDRVAPPVDRGPEPRWSGR